jgi:hypothetical protein
MMRRLIGVFAFSFALLSAQGAGAQTILKTQEIRGAFVGNTLVVRFTANGRVTVTEYVDPSGTLLGIDDAGKRISGKYSIERDSWCVTWTHTTGSYCFRVRRNLAGFEFLDTNGQPLPATFASAITVRAGDASNLVVADTRTNQPETRTNPAAIAAKKDVRGVTLGMPLDVAKAIAQTNVGGCGKILPEYLIIGCGNANGTEKLFFSYSPASRVYEIESRQRIPGATRSALEQTVKEAYGLGAPRAVKPETSNPLCGISQWTLPSGSLLAFSACSIFGERDFNFYLKLSDERLKNEADRVAPRL